MKSLSFGLAAALIAGCASTGAPPTAPHQHPPEPGPPAVAPVPEATTTVAVSPPAASSAVAPQAPPPPPTGAAAPGDECHVSAVLAEAYGALGQGEREATWMANARAKLLSREDAERAFPGPSQEILSALAHRRYDKLAGFAGKDGICMRAAKGAPCQMLSPAKLAGCAASGVKTAWAVDSGAEESPRYTCSEAFKHVFYARDFLHVGKPRFNCFPAPGRGNNASPLIESGPRLGYVELFSEGPDGYRSLWLVFDGSPTDPELVEMISDYPGI